MTSTVWTWCHVLAFPHSHALVFWTRSTGVWPAQLEHDVMFLLSHTVMLLCLWQDQLEYDQHSWNMMSCSCFPTQSCSCVYDKINWSMTCTVGTWCHVHAFPHSHAIVFWTRSTGVWPAQLEHDVMLMLYQAAMLLYFGETQILWNIITTL